MESNANRRNCSASTSRNAQSNHLSTLRNSGRRGLATRAQLKRRSPLHSASSPKRKNLKRKRSTELVNLTRTSDAEIDNISSPTKKPDQSKPESPLNKQLSSSHSSPPNSERYVRQKSNKKIPLKISHKIFRLESQDKKKKKNAAVAITKLNKSAVRRKSAIKLKRQKNKPGASSSLPILKQQTTASSPNSKNRFSRLSSLRSATRFKIPQTENIQQQTSSAVSENASSNNSNASARLENFPGKSELTPGHAKENSMHKSKSPGESKPSTSSGSLSVDTSDSESDSDEVKEKGKKKRRPVLIYDHITIIPSENGDPVMYECSICKKKFKTKAHIKYHKFCKNGNKPYKCNLCSEGFIAKSHFEYHLRTHTGERPYKCPKCGKGFNQQGKVTRHMRSHTGEKPFVCEECNRGFANKQALKAHSLVHTGERPYACTFCDKSFTGMTNLKKHIVTHTGERPFKCTQCGKAFGQKWTLQLHLKTHSSERPFVCDQCTFGFSNKKDLRRHLVIHSGERPFKCWICGTAFCRKDNLDRHIKNTHNQSKEVAKKLANEAAAEYLALKSSKSSQEKKDEDQNSEITKPVQTTTDETTSLPVKEPLKPKLQKSTSSEKFPAIEEEESATATEDFKCQSTDSYILPNDQTDIPIGSLEFEYAIDNSNRLISCVDVQGLTELLPVPTEEYQGTDGLHVLETSKTVNTEEEACENKSQSLQISKSDSEIAESITAAVNVLDAEVEGWESDPLSSTENFEKEDVTFDASNEIYVEGENFSEGLMSETTTQEQSKDEQDVTVTVVFKPDGTTQFIADKDESKESSEDESEGEETANVLELPSEISGAFQPFMDECYTNNQYQMSLSENDLRPSLSANIEGSSEECSSEDSSIKFSSRPDSPEEKIEADIYVSHVAETETNDPLPEDYFNDMENDIAIVKFDSEGIGKKIWDAFEKETLKRYVEDEKVTILESDQDSEDSETAYNAEYNMLKESFSEPKEKSHKGNVNEENNPKSLENTNEESSLSSEEPFEESQADVLSKKCDELENETTEENSDTSDENYKIENQTCEAYLIEEDSNSSIEKVSWTEEEENEESNPEYLENTDEESACVFGKPLRKSYTDVLAEKYDEIESQSTDEDHSHSELSEEDLYADLIEKSISPSDLNEEHFSSQLNENLAHKISEENLTFKLTEVNLSSNLPDENLASKLIEKNLATKLIEKNLASKLIEKNLASKLIEKNLATKLNEDLSLKLSIEECISRVSNVSSGDPWIAAEVDNTIEEGDLMIIESENNQEGADKFHPMPSLAIPNDDSHFKLSKLHKEYLSSKASLNTEMEPLFNGEIDDINEKICTPEDNPDRHIKNTHNQSKEVAKKLANEAAAEYLALKSSKSSQEKKDEDQNSEITKPVQTTTDETTSLPVKEPLKPKLQKSTSSEKFPAIEEEESATATEDFKCQSTDSYILPNDQTDIPIGSLEFEYAIDNSNRLISCVDVQGLTELLPVSTEEYQGTDGLHVLETSKKFNTEEEACENKSQSLQISKSDSEIAESITAAVNVLDAEVEGWESDPLSSTEKLEKEDVTFDASSEIYVEGENFSEGLMSETTTQEQSKDEQDVTVTVVFKPDGTTQFIADKDESKESSEDESEGEETANHVLGSEISVASQPFMDECYTNNQYQMSPSENDIRSSLSDKIQESSEESSNKESTIKSSRRDSPEEKIETDNYVSRVAETETNDALPEDNFSDMESEFAIVKVVSEQKAEKIWDALENETLKDNVDEENVAILENDQDSEEAANNEEYKMSKANFSETKEKSPNESYNEAYNPESLENTNEENSLVSEKPFEESHADVLGEECNELESQTTEEKSDVPDKNDYKIENQACETHLIEVDSNPLMDRVSRTEEEENEENKPKSVENTDEENARVSGKPLEKFYTNVLAEKCSEIESQSTEEDSLVHSEVLDKNVNKIDNKTCAKDVNEAENNNSVEKVPKTEDKDNEANNAESLENVNEESIRVSGKFSKKSHVLAEKCNEIKSQYTAENSVVVNDVPHKNDDKIENQTCTKDLKEAENNTLVEKISSPKEEENVVPTSSKPAKEIVGFNTYLDYDGLDEISDDEGDSDDEVSHSDIFEESSKDVAPENKAKELSKSFLNDVSCIISGSLSRLLSANNFSANRNQQGLGTAIKSNRNDSPVNGAASTSEKCRFFDRDSFSKLFLQDTTSKMCLQESPSKLSHNVSIEPLVNGVTELEEGELMIAEAFSDDDCASGLSDDDSSSKLSNEDLSLKLSREECVSRLSNDTSIGPLIAPEVDNTLEEGELTIIESDHREEADNFDQESSLSMSNDDSDFKLSIHQKSSKLSSTDLSSTLWIEDTISKLPNEDLSPKASLNTDMEPLFNGEIDDTLEEGELIIAEPTANEDPENLDSDCSSKLTKEYSFPKLSDQNAFSNLSLKISTSLLPNETTEELPMKITEIDDTLEEGELIINESPSREETDNLVQKSSHCKHSDLTTKSTTQTSSSNLSIEDSSSKEPIKNSFSKLSVKDLSYKLPLDDISSKNISEVHEKDQTNEEHEVNSKSTEHEKDLILEIHEEDSNSKEREETAKIEEEELASELNNENTSPKLNEEYMSAKQIEEDLPCYLLKDELSSNLLNENSTSKSIDKHSHSELSEEDLYADLIEKSPSDLKEEDNSAKLNEDNVAPKLTEENLTYKLTEVNLASNLPEENLASNLIEKNLATKLIEKNLANKLIEKNLANKLIEKNLASKLIEKNLATKLNEDLSLKLSIEECISRVSNVSSGDPWIAAEVDNTIEEGDLMIIESENNQEGADKFHPMPSLAIPNDDSHFKLSKLHKEYLSSKASLNTEMEPLFNGEIDDINEKVCTPEKEITLEVHEKPLIPDVDEMELTPEVHERELTNEVHEKELTPEVHEKELTPGVYEEELTPEVHEKELTPEVHEKELTPEVHEKELTPGVHEEELTPEVHGKELTPEVHEKELTPEVHEKELTPGVHEEELTPEVHEKELTSEVHEKELTPEVLEKELTPEVHEKELTPEVHEKELTPEVHEKELTPEVHEKELTPEVHEKELTPEVHEKELTPGVHEEELTREIHEKELTREIHEKELTREIHEKELTREIHEKELTREIHEKELTPEIREVDLNPEVHETDLICEIQDNKLPPPTAYEKNLASTENKEELNLVHCQSKLAIKKQRSKSFFPGSQLKRSFKRSSSKVTKDIAVKLERNEKSVRKSSKNRKELTNIAGKTSSKKPAYFSKTRECLSLRPPQKVVSENQKLFTTTPIPDVSPPHVPSLGILENEYAEESGSLVDDVSVAQSGTSSETLLKREIGQQTEFDPEFGEPLFLAARESVPGEEDIVSPKPPEFEETIIDENVSSDSELNVGAQYNCPLKDESEIAETPDPTAKGIIVCHFDFSEYANSMRSPESLSGWKSPVNFPLVETETKMAIINPLRPRKVREYFASYKWPSRETEELKWQSEHTSSPAVFTNTEVNSAPEQAPRNIKRKFSNTPTSCTERTFAQPTYEDMGSVIYSQTSTTDQNSTAIPPSVIRKNDFVHPKTVDIPPGSSPLERCGIQFICDNESYFGPINPANIHFVRVDGDQPSLESDKSFGEVLYAVAAVTVDPQDGNSGPPAKLRLLYAEAIGIQKQKSNTESNQAQLYYAATTPNQEIDISNPRILLDQPRLINTEYGQNQEENLQIVIAPHINYSENAAPLPIEVSVNGNTAVAQSVVREDEKLSLISRSRAMHHWYPSITTHPQYHINQEYSLPLSTYSSDTEDTNSRRNATATSESSHDDYNFCVPTDTKSYLKSRGLTTPRRPFPYTSNNSGTYDPGFSHPENIGNLSNPSDRAKTVELDSRSQWESAEGHGFDLQRFGNSLGRRKSTSSLNTLANVVTYVKDTNNDANVSQFAARNRQIQAETDAAARAAVVIAAVGNAAREKRLKELRELGNKSPHLGPRKQYLSDSHNFPNNK